MTQRSLFEPNFRGVQVGFTGTQRGMTRVQVDGVRAYLKGTCTLAGFVGRHGDCIGADADFHRCAIGLLACNAIIVHPPIIDTKRAFCHWGPVPVLTLPPKPYLSRNHDIVDNCEVMLATPNEREEQGTSGTWATIRYAKKVKRVLRIYWPDGGFADFNGAA